MITPGGFIKYSAKDYDARQLALQQFLPTRDRRVLSPEEEASIAAGESRWFPRIFESYGTPIPELMADPTRNALLAGGIAGLLGGGVGALYGRGVSGVGAKAMGMKPAGGVVAGSGLGALLGAAALGLPTAALTYFHRKAQNEGLREMMRRLPAGAVRRDLDSDPAHQANMNRAAMVAANNGRFY